MGNNLQKNILSVHLEPCPFCGSTDNKLTYDVMYGAVKGVYCSGCKSFTKFNPLVTRKSTAQEWADSYNRRA